MKESKFSENFLQSHWQDYFEINTKLVPNFLKQSADIIFKTGKFSYTMKHCKCDKITIEKNIDYNFLGKDIYTQIYEYHLRLSKAFIEFFSENMRLHDHLTILRSTFLLGRSRFIEDFLSFSNDELSKDSDGTSKLFFYSILQVR